MTQNSKIVAVDLFCGAGGLTNGLLQSGISVIAGIDNNDYVKYAFEKNSGAKFISRDISTLDSSEISELWDSNSIRLLAGCAPCQPFSRITHGNSEKKSKHRHFNLLNHFERLISETLPELVMMENVPELAYSENIFSHLLHSLDAKGYSVDYKVVPCVEYGVPQSRRRLILLASRLNHIEVPTGRYTDPKKWKTVRDTISNLSPLKSGEKDKNDPLHVATSLSQLNLRRIESTRHDGGTRKDWDDDLVLNCHRKKSGKSYTSVYARMWWDKPAPTMTTMCTGIGNGRFGHPDQDRAITLREAALLQSFDIGYEFWPQDQKLNRRAVSIMIGNAVPPLLAKCVGEELLNHINHSNV